MSRPENEALLETIKLIVRRAIVTLMTLRDPDRKYQRMPQTAWLLPVINNSQESYGYREYGFEPTAIDLQNMEIIAKWLAWLRRAEGEDALRRLLRWATGMPPWRMALLEHCCERTIRNRTERSIAAMMNNFVALDLQIELVEPDHIGAASYNGKLFGPSMPYSLDFEKAPGPHGGPVILKKVYVHEKGFLRGGRRIRDGRHRAEKFEVLA